MISLSNTLARGGPGDLDSIPGRVMPKMQKMVLDVSLLNSQYYKVSIKGKGEQSRERSSTSPTPWCSSYRTGNLRVTLDYGRQIYLLVYIIWRKQSRLWKVPTVDGTLCIALIHVWFESWTCIQELILYTFKHSHNAMEATKNICYAKSEDTVYHSIFFPRVSFFLDMSRSSHAISLVCC